MRCSPATNTCHASRPISLAAGQAFGSGGLTMVVPDTVRKVSRHAEEGDFDNDDGQNDTTSAAFLDLTGPDGPYANGINGEGVVVGIIDTGIWPEHPSLDPTGFGPAPASFVGAGCDFVTTIHTLDAAFSSTQVLSAKSYPAALTAEIHPFYLSARTTRSRTPLDDRCRNSMSRPRPRFRFGTVPYRTPGAPSPRHVSVTEGAAARSRQPCSDRDAVAMGGMSQLLLVDRPRMRSRRLSFSCNHAAFSLPARGNEGPPPNCGRPVSPGDRVGASQRSTSSTVTLAWPHSRFERHGRRRPAPLVDSARSAMALPERVGFTGPSTADRAVQASTMPVDKREVTRRALDGAVHAFTARGDDDTFRAVVPIPS